MKTATDETVTVLWTPDRARRQDAARAQRAADAERALKEQKRQAKAQRKEQKRLEREQEAAQKRLEWEQERLEWERQAAWERMGKRLRASAELDSAAVGVGILVPAAVVFFVGALVTGGEWLGWCGLAAVIGAVVCAHVTGDPDPFPPSPEVLNLAMDLTPDAASALERVLDSREQKFALASSAQREQRRRALLVRAVHALGDGAASIVDNAIKQGLDPLTGLLEAALNTPR